MHRLAPLLLVACVGGTPGTKVPDRLDDDDPECANPATWYEDHDEDGFGDATSTKSACKQPVGYLTDATDCDDDDAGTYPGAIEVCDGVDRDCDGVIDGPNSVDAPAWHPDLDGDGFGDAASEVRACVRPEGLSRDDSDCDDDDKAIHPGAPDPACDGIDQDCGGTLEVEAAQIGGRVFDSLAAAIAASASGDTIEVCEGVHAVSARVEHDLTVRGVAADASGVVVDGGGTHRILDIEAQRLGLERLTFRGGAATDGAGGAVRARLRDLTVSDVIFESNHAATDGGAIWLRLDGDTIDATLTDVVFEANGAGSDGGAMAVHLATSDYVTLERAVFRDNVAGGNGGGIRLTGGENTAVLAARDVVALDNAAGLDGGWLSARSFAHVILRLTDIEVQRGQAGERGGLIAIEAPGDAKLDITGAVLADGTAGIAGGLIAHRGDFTLDLKLHQAELDSGSAPTGGLAWVYTGGTGHLDWFESTLHHGEASAGAAFFLAGESTGFDGKMAKTVIRDNAGGPAVQVDDELVYDEAVGFELAYGSLLRNAGGGFSVPTGFVVELTESDAGSGSDDNADFDVRQGDTTHRFEGVVSVVCDDGVCE